MLKLVIISKLILDKNENFLLFNFIGIDFRYLFINYTSKSYFDQYYPNINHFSDQIIKHKSLTLKSILTKSISTKLILS